jgi:ATP-dependent Clp protease ATP-binding subunit ClpC
LQRNSSLGFSSGNADDFDKTKDKIMDEAKKTFKPEFLNRLTEIVIFRPLVKESMRAIVDLELKKVTDRLKEKKLKLKISDEVKEFLIEKGYDSKLGARPLRRAVEKYLEDSLAEEVLSGSLRKNKIIHVLITDEEEPSLYFSQDVSDEKVSVSPSSKAEDKDTDS